MKKALFLLIASALVMLLLLQSCAVPYQTNRQYAKALGATRPKFTGAGSRVSLETHTAVVYQNGVSLVAKSGAIQPSEICIYDLDGDKIFETAYVRANSPDSWRVYHNFRPVRGVTTVPNSLTAQEAMDYFTLAYKAKYAIKAPAVAVRPTFKSDEPLAKDGWKLLEGHPGKERIWYKEQQKAP